MLYAGIPPYCGSIGPKQECLANKISFAEHANIVPADIAICGTITLILLLNLLCRYFTIPSVAVGFPPGVCKIKSKPLEQSNPLSAFINPVMSLSLISMF